MAQFRSPERERSGCDERGVRQENEQARKVPVMVSAPGLEILMARDGARLFLGRKIKSSSALTGI